MITFKLVFDANGQQVISNNFTAENARDVAALLVMAIHLNGKMKDPFPLISVIVPQADEEDAVNRAVPTYENDGGAA